MTVPTPEETTETEVLETKVEETAEKLEEAKTSEYATKEDISGLTTMLAEFRKDLDASKTAKPVVPAPEKKPEPKSEKKPEPVAETPKVEEKGTSYGSKRWFGGR